MLARDGAAIDLIELERVAFTLGGRIGFQVQNALAASAAAWASGLEPGPDRPRADDLPGRRKTVAGPLQPDARPTASRSSSTTGTTPRRMAALGQAVQALGDRRTVMLLALPGDRRDEDLRRHGRGDDPATPTSMCSTTWPTGASARAARCRSSCAGLAGRIDQSPWPRTRPRRYGRPGGASTPAIASS